LKERGGRQGGKVSIETRSVQMPWGKSKTRPKPTPHYFRTYSNCGVGRGKGSRQGAGQQERKGLGVPLR